MRATRSFAGSLVVYGRFALWFLISLFGTGILFSPATRAQDPNPHGNWQIYVWYSGNASSNVTPQPPAVYTASIDSSGSGSALSANPSLDLSTLTNQPPSTLTGGVTASLQAFAERVQSNGTGETDQSG